jgi:hypothetical protein
MIGFDSQFKYCSIATYGNIESISCYQDKHNSILYSQPISCRGSLLWVSDKQIIECSWNRQPFTYNFNSRGWLRRGVGSFFIYRAEQRERRIERRQEEEKIPELGYDGLYHTQDEEEEIAGRIKLKSTYFLRVKMKNGEGMAEHCVAFLTVDGSNISHSPCVWADKTRICDIARDLHMDLYLFTLVKERTSDSKVTRPVSLKFASASTDMFYSNTGIPYAENERSYAKYSEKQIKVKLGAKKGRLPETFVKSVEEIISEAKTEG